MSGRGKMQQKSKNAWGNNTTKPQPKTQTKEKAKVEDKFNEAHQKHINAAKKLMQNYESSSDEEEIAENEGILESVFKGYTGSSDDLVKTHQFLENIFQSGAAICLICIGSVKRADAIWSCVKCYTFFHLQCTQRWANDSVSQKEISHELEQGYYNNQGEYIPKKTKSIHWDCPKCRTTYTTTQIPRHYECFCAKEVNPAFHPWLIPHSCGEKCGKPLQPDCGHKCLLLCHPGACPPCPQMILKSCKCEKSAAKMIRCSQKTWTCLKKCTLKLSCDIHECGLVCHASNECPPCKKRSVQKCCCGGQKEERNCSQSAWKCAKACGKLFACGLHKCQKVCHNGVCGECPLGRPRSCPCGKQKSVAPCSEQIESCGGTCQKKLECGIHQCVERCHNGKCSECLDIVEKKCRCGQHTKELRCSKSFTCETKCKQARECKKHPCNRKCCDGQCPPCDKICGKVLSCTKHKCQSLCHNGPCYPCNLRSQVKCRCGNTVIGVSCGRERKTKAPKCAHPCKIPSTCHHANPHRCHMNECPQCVEACGLKNTTTNCNHPCEVKCHDAVKVSIVDKNFKPALPWEVQVEQFEVKKLPHPPCNIKVPVTCIGGHEESMWPCCNSKSMSCGRLCGRELSCGNHTCQLECHTVQKLNSKVAEISCQDCQSECLVPRKYGCLHPCKMACHPPPCTPCNAFNKTTCHCGVSQVFFRCGQYYRNTETEEDETLLRAEQERVMSCSGRCTKKYPCGHRCVSPCHSGPCPNPEQCRKKVKLTCPCKNLKSEVLCEKMNLEKVTMLCDGSCQKKITEQKELTKLRELELKKAEEEKNRIELEEFEKKFGKKKPRERKAVIAEETHDNSVLIYGSIAGAVITIISLIIYFVVLN